MKNKIIDLSLSLKEGIITYPSTSHIQFESSILGRIEIEGRETRKFTMGSHCGTHIDAPKHFLKGGKSVIDFDVNDLIVFENLKEIGLATIFELLGFCRYPFYINKILPLDRDL